MQDVVIYIYRHDGRLYQDDRLPESVSQEDVVAFIKILNTSYRIRGATVVASVESVLAALKEGGHDAHQYFPQDEPPMKLDKIKRGLEQIAKAKLNK